VDAVARNVDRNEIYEDFSSVLASARQTRYFPKFSNFVTRVIDTSQEQGAVLRHLSVREEQLGFQPK